MADISEISKRLRAWPSINDPKRFYVNNVDRLIHDKLWKEYTETGFHKPLDVVRYATVWFDMDASVHVKGIYDPRAAEVIARLVDDEFCRTYSMDELTELDWAEATDALPHDIKDQTYLFEYKGRIYYVNVTVYCFERDNNKALRFPDGDIAFESKSSDLWELVIELIKDGKVRQKTHTDAFPFVMTSGGDTPGRIDSSYARNLNPDDPERARLEYRPPERKETKPERKEAPVHPQERQTYVRRYTQEEYDRIVREQAAETTHPMSKWTKAEIIEVCEKAGVPCESISALKRMKLADIRATCMVYDGTEITGNDYNSEQQRHTKFYRLDMDVIRMLGDDE